MDSDQRRRYLYPAYGGLHLLVSLLTGISLPKSAEVGPGLRIYHFGGIVVHPLSVIGSNVTLGHGVTLGVREDAERAPVIGDHVVLSAYAQVLGGVRVGDRSKVGALSLVLKDVPPGVSVAGIPAKVLRAGHPEAGASQ